MSTDLAWSGCRNVRDVGGLPTTDGRRVQPRRLVRSDTLDLLDDDGVRSFDAYDVARVVDLRGVIPGEPGPFAPVLVHCAAGKDRTGGAVALLLEVAGVAREDVVADYAVSEERLGVPEILAAHPEGPARDRLERMSRTLPETMTGALEHLDAAYGGAAGYLVEACGLLPRDLVGVRRRLVEP